jgi:hypothetical protein
MPTPQGAETIGERLKRLRTELTAVRATIARVTSNAQSFAMPGTQVTEIAYERATTRERELVDQIARLEARLAASRANRRVAQTKTVVES